MQSPPPGRWRAGVPSPSRRAGTSPTSMCSHEGGDVVMAEASADFERHDLRMENLRSFYAQAWCGFTCCTELPVVGSRVGAVPPQGPFPTPATSNGACGFPALRFLADFTPRSATVVMWWPGIGSWRRTRSARAARHRSTHVVESGAASRTGEAQAGPDRTQCRRQPPDGRRRFRLNSGIDSFGDRPVC